MSVRIISIAAIVIGLALEILRVGSEWSLGTIIAGIGIVAFVYDRMVRQPKRKS